MKIGPRLASALVALLAEEKVDHAAAADAAMEILKKSSPSEISGFPRQVARALKKSLVIHARIDSAVELSSEEKTALTKAIAHAADPRPVEMSSHTHKSLIGGAVLQIQDERLDMSIVTALKHLEASLLSSTR
jgi:F0F1-type ATP synthase delta subunit